MVSSLEDEKRTAEPLRSLSYAGANRIRFGGFISAIDRLKYRATAPRATRAA
jgi:hypothetical protein